MLDMNRERKPGAMPRLSCDEEGCKACFMVGGYGSPSRERIRREAALYGWTYEARGEGRRRRAKDRCADCSKRRDT